MNPSIEILAKLFIIEKFRSKINFKRGCYPMKNENSLDTMCAALAYAMEISYLELCGALRSLGAIVPGADLL